jgi:polysaccharide deacetylase family protein (PEP-CTERM system associated)
LALSVDVEEYFHAWALSPVIRPDDWPRWPSRVEPQTRRILDLFAEAGVSATFFVLGWVAERQPALVRAIVAAGHELASHGYGHAKVATLGPDAFRADALRARRLLEDIAGVPVLGYRAPSFSIDGGCWWAYDCLAEAGYRYSSSLHPIRHDHYGMPDGPTVPFWPVAGVLQELPVATIRLLGRRVSCAGGGHFRLMPYGWSAWCLRRLARPGAPPPIFYCHPWELDPGQPRVPGLPWRSRCRHYSRQASMAARLRRLLRAFRWQRIDRCYPRPPAATAVAA